MARAKTIAFIIKTDDLFSAMLDNGGVRFGMPGTDMPMFDLPATHPRYKDVVTADLCTLETIYDEFFASTLK